MMETRILPRGEWARMEEAPVLLFPFAHPDNVAQVVTEDGGQVVGCVTVLQTSVLEGMWIAPAHRGHAGVARGLMRQAGAIVRSRGEGWALAGAEHDQMRGFMGRLGAVPVPMDLYALSVRGRE